jgi:hypothetical protein
MTKECLITHRRDELMKMLDDQSLSLSQRGEIIELIKHCHKILFTLEMQNNNKA